MWFFIVQVNHFETFTWDDHQPVNPSPIFGKPIVEFHRRTPSFRAWLGLTGSQTRSTSEIGKILAHSWKDGATDVPAVQLGASHFRILGCFFAHICELALASRRVTDGHRDRGFDWDGGEQQQHISFLNHSLYLGVICCATGSVCISFSLGSATGIYIGITQV